MATFSDPNVKKVINSWSNAAIQSLAIALCAIGLAYLLNTFGKIDPLYILSLEVFSLALAASTVLGASGVVCWSGVTKAEQLEKRLLHWMTRTTLFFSILTLSFWYFVQSSPGSS